MSDNVFTQAESILQPAKVSCARIFTNDALANIQVDLGQAKTVEEFLSTVEERATDPEQTLPMTPSFQLTRPLSTHAHEWENAITVYESLPKLDPASASDPRLWDYLALINCRTYIERRWQILNTTNWKKRVKDRWFFLHPSRSALIRHGIGRLWWITNLTYDSDCSHRLSGQNNDRFAYTRWVLENEDRVISIFDRRLGAIPQLRFALLDAMQDSSRINNSAAIRDAARQIRLQLSLREFGMLTPNELGESVSEIIRNSITEQTN
jgi:hypothetical protein